MVGLAPCFLDYFSLNDCNLEGPLPTELGTLWNMTRLQLHNNYFEGTIPSHLGRMQQLDLLTLEGNLLKGTVPKQLCNLRMPEGVDKDDAKPGKTLRQLVVDCYNERQDIGFDCRIPECCTLCRNTRW